jgi:hypothetical protein
MRLDTFLEELLKPAIQKPLTEETALHWMILLHTHRIILSSPLLEDCPNVVCVRGLTQRGAAKLIAALWPDRNDIRATYEHWYWEFNTKGPCEMMDDVSDSVRDAILALRLRLLENPRVADVVEED